MHVLCFVHSIGEWATCRKKYHKSFSLFSITTKKHQPYYCIRVSMLTRLENTDASTEIKNELFGLKTVLIKKKVSARQTNNRQSFTIVTCPFEWFSISIKLNFSLPMNLCIYPSIVTISMYIFLLDLNPNRADMSDLTIQIMKWFSTGEKKG